MVVFAIIVGVMIALIAAKPASECVRSHTERYYDSSYTAIAITTKNYGLLGLNGYKNREVCDEYKEVE